MAGAGTATGTRRSGHVLLGLYLNDHLAGATGGLELARRVAASHPGPADDGVLQRLPAEVAQDRAALRDIMAALGVPVRSYKVCAAWIGEKAARLKLNGYLLTRSPLSSLEELEMLRLGVEGKAAGWRTLRVLAETDKRLDSGRLDDLIASARRQADLLEQIRVRAAGPGHRCGGDGPRLMNDIATPLDDPARKDARADPPGPRRELARPVLIRTGPGCSSNG